MAIDMLEQATGRVIVAVVYPVLTETQARSPIVIGDNCVGGLVVVFIKYVTRADIVLVILGHGIHRPAPHEAVVVAGKQSYFLARKISCRIVDSTGDTRSNRRSAY